MVVSTEDTAVGNMVEFDTTKRQGSIAEDKKFYYCQGFSSITVATRTCILEHQHTMSLGYG